MTNPVTPEGFEVAGAIPIYIAGPTPHGNVWCATCVMLYQGSMGADEEIRKSIREQYEAAVKVGRNFLLVALPDHDHIQLQPAITVAPSELFEVPMPVCWTHVKGYRFTTKAERQAGHRNRLIQGKKYTSSEDMLTWGMDPNT